ncbi:MAG: DUF5666 domain-containing protein [Janthinobacterium lividum]
MKQPLWKSALLCSVLMGGFALVTRAQNATSGGDQQSQPDAQTRRSAGGPNGGQGGRRGGGIRGTVTAVNGSNVTLKTEEGQTWTVISTDNTRVRRDSQPGTVSGIQTGDEVVAMGMPDADKHEVHALMLMDVSAAEVAKAKANLGKTYIVGRITAINDTQLTIMRSDHVSQVITLDESTSLHRGGRINQQALAAAGLDMSAMGGMGGGRGMGGGGRRGDANADAPQDDAGEAITLADVKVGDNVAGTGIVKQTGYGTRFVPTDLHVMERRIGSVGRPGAAPPPQ